MNFLIKILFLILFHFSYVLNIKAQPDTINGLTFWFKADASVFYDNNNRVYEWHDVSGNNYFLSQPDSSLQPIFINSVDSLNFKPAIRFYNSTLTLNQTINIASIFLIVNYYFDIFQYYSGLFTRINVIDGNTDYLLTSNITGTSFYSCIFNNNLFINNIQTYNFSPMKRPKLIYGFLTSPVQWEDLMIGLDRSLSGRYWYGNIFEIIAFNRVLNQFEKLAVENYIKNKYAPPIQLPDDTVFTTFCPQTIKVNGYFTQYLWNTGETNDSIIVEHSGTYIVTATDIFGRQSTDSIYVQFPKPWNIDTLKICYGDSILLSSSLGPSFTYQWSNGTTNSYIYLKEQDWYFVTITDIQDCQKIDSIFLKVDSLPLLPLFSSDTTNLCEGNMISIENTNLNIVHYMWQPTNDTTSFTIVQNAGWYYITVQNANSCLKADSIYVNIIGKAPIVQFDNSHTCLQQYTTLLSTSYSQDTSQILHYTWIINQNDTVYGSQVNYLFQTHGYHSVELQAITSSGCYQNLKDSIIVFPLPEVNFIAKGFCESEITWFISSTSIAFGQVVDYLWNFGDGNTSNDEHPTNIFNQNGTYQVSFTAISEQGCQKNISKEIEIKYKPKAGFLHGASCVQKHTYFDDTSKTLSFYPIIEWKWDFGNGSYSTQQNPITIYNSIGNYEVKLAIKILNGCTDTANKIISVSSSPLANFVCDSACEYQMLTAQDISQITNGSIENRKWYISSQFYSNQQSINIVPYQTGALPITLIVQSNTNCFDTITKVLDVKPKPQVSFSADNYYGTVPLTVNFLNTSDTGQYYWFFGDGKTSSHTNPQHTYTDTGKYSVWLKVIDNYGCYDSINKVILVVPNLLDLAIEDISIQTFSSYITVIAKVVNMGTLPIENPELQLWANGRFMISEILFDTLFSGEHRWYLFNGKINSETLNPLYLCVKGIINTSYSEILYNNNSFCKAIEEKEQVLNFYPNPARDILVIEYSLYEIKNVSITISDIIGRQLYMQHILANQEYNRIELNISFLPQGMYIINLQTEQINFKRMFIKL